MDNVAVARVNAALEKMRRQIGLVESRSQNFQSSTSESVSRVQEWAEEVVDTDRKHSTLYMTAITEMEERCARELEVERLAKRNLKANEDKEQQFYQQLLELEDQLENLQLQKHEIPKEQRRLEHAASEKIKQQMQRQKAVQQTANQLQSKIDDIKESVGLYSEILGMRLEAIADKSLCCAFRCINRRMPSEEYKVVIASVDKLFSATECNPMVPEFRSLQRRLKDDQDLLKFLKSMRAAFKQYVS